MFTYMRKVAPPQHLIHDSKIFKRLKKLVIILIKQTVFWRTNSS